MTVRPCDLIIYPEWLIRIEPDVEPLTNFGVVISDGRIVDVDTKGALEARYSGPTSDLPGQVMMPGLVNAHTHSGMNLLRGIADDLPLQHWLEERIWPIEGEWVGPEYVTDGTRLAVAEMLLGGVTCFADMYFFPERVAAVADDAGIRAVTGMIAVEFPSAYAKEASEYISKGLALHDQYSGHPLISTMFAPHAPYTVSDDTLGRIRLLADQLDIPVQMHVNETQQELDQAKQKGDERPIKRLDRLGLVNANLVAVHCTVLGDADIELFAERGVSVVHCPRSNLKLASGACPTGELRRAGINLALGSDGAASNNRVDLWGDLQLAPLLAKWQSSDATALPAAEVLRAATLGGAQALNLDQDCGSIQPGKAADLITVDLSGVRSQPVYNPLSQLVYATDASQVANVWVAGQRLVEDGRLIHQDTEEIVARARMWRNRIGEKEQA